MGNIDDITRKGKYDGEVQHLEANRDKQINEKHCSEKQDLRHINTLRIR